MITPVYVPAASVDAFAFTVSVAGALDPELVTVSHSESEVAVNGTVLPLPSAVTWIICDDGFCTLPWPLNVNAVGETCSTGLLVTTRVTGSVVTLGWPETPTTTVVV